MADALPTSPTPRAITITWQANSLVFRSPLSGAAQTSSRLGGVWVITLDMPPMTRYTSGQWQAALFGVDGVATALAAGPDHPKPVDSYNASANTYSADDATTVSLDFTRQDYAVRYVTAPTVLVNGAASAQATSLAVDGLNGVGLNKGDWISFSNGTFDELHIVTADAFPNSSGEATLTIHPPLRRAVANNAAVTIESPKGEFLYADPGGASFIKDERGVTTPQAIQLIEFIR
jgi:hypothetical protein